MMTSCLPRRCALCGRKIPPGAAFRTIPPREGSVPTLRGIRVQPARRYAHPDGHCVTLSPAIEYARSKRQP